MQVRDLDPAEAKSVAALLDEALDLAPAQRVPWQAELARREPKLSSLVAELLASMTDGAARTDDLGTFDPTQLVARALLRASEATGSLEGRQLGSYRVLRLIGRGGMGSVWLAERADGMFERKVALKVMHPGLLGDAARAHFARECRILGALEHPLIARLLDAGISADDLPYLAIEYVEGTSISVHCDAQRLTMPARIALMIDVLAAVQHAHQNLVIHGDLKPANILVTPEGQVRLLDFGVARLLTQDPASETDAAQPGARALTPNYASPEQLAGQAVSTASDVYALGVLLYTLLCGQRPYELKGDAERTLESQIAASRSPPPSQRPSSAAIAAARSTTPKKLRRALGGDLDAIVLKAMRKDPRERYATADALLQDLKRYLAARPVQARRDTFAYRLAKFVGRNRFEVVAGLVIVSALVGATVTSLQQGRLARREEASARREANKAEVVQELLVAIFKTNSVLQPDPMRARQTTARELLDVGARLAVGKLEGSPEAQQEVLNTLSDMYAQLGLYEEAARMRTERLRALRQAHGSSDLKVAAALLDFAADVIPSRQRAQAGPAIEEAARILAGSADSAPETRGWLEIVSSDYEQYLSIPEMRRHADAAVSHFREHPDHWTALWSALRASGRARYFAGDLEGAESELRGVLDEVARHGGSAEWTITPLVLLAEVQFTALKLREAEASFRAAWDVARRTRGEKSGITVQIQAKLGGFLHASGRREEGKQLLDAALAASIEEKANSSVNAVTATYRNRGSALFEEGRIAEAEASFASDIEHLRSYSPNAVPLVRSLLLRATALTALGRYDDSREALDEAERLGQASGADLAPASGIHDRQLERARWLLARGDADGATTLLSEQLAGRESAMTPRAAAPLHAAEVQFVLACAHLQQGRTSDALRAAQEGLTWLQASPERSHFPLLEAEGALRVGQAQRLAGDLASARKNLEHALALREAQQSANSPWIAEARVALAECFLDLGEARAAHAQLEQAKKAHAAYELLGEHFRAPLRATLERAARDPY